jgi:hypothetical protein
MVANPKCKLCHTRIAIAYARIALSAAFLSGSASRFGLYPKGVGYGNFANFMRYTARSIPSCPRPPSHFSHLNQRERAREKPRNPDEESNEI